MRAISYKLKNRLALSLLATGMVVMVVLLLTHGLFIDRVIVAEYLRVMEAQARQGADYMEAHFLENFRILRTLTEASSQLREELRKSNQRYGRLAAVEREAQVKSLDQRWRAAAGPEDPLVKTYLHNRTAQILEKHEALFPEVYGEIFVTNRYGLLLGATNQLTTMAHAHKYWWQAAYHEGRGAMFIDDRGYDDSVGAVVLGFVVPVRAPNGEVTGILKANVNIAASLRHLVEEFNKVGLGNMKVVRDNGEVVYEAGRPPLSTRLPSSLLSQLQHAASKVLETRIDGKRFLIASARVRKSGPGRHDGYLFGGKRQSIDHTKGWDGSWYILVQLPLERALGQAHAQLRQLAVVVACLVLLLALVAYRIGARLAQPTEEILKAVRAYGQGRLDYRLNLGRQDELGELAEAINAMGENLQQITASRDLLEQEVARRKQVEQKLERLASIDELTGSFNRRQFRRRLRQEVMRAERYGSSFALLMLDIDHFKQVNDRFGHDAGDKVLQEFARLIEESVREVDVFARWGGEEFFLLLPNADPDTARQTAERLRRGVAANPFPHSLQITVSIGFAVYHPGESPDSLLQRVDSALYRAKQHGRNRVEGPAPPS